MPYNARLLICVLLMTVPAMIGCEPSVGLTPARAGVTAAAVAEEPQPAATPEATQATAADEPPCKGVKDDEAVLYDSGYEEDNSSCMVCHIDFEKELISSTHLEAGVTCAGCHGDSEVHRADEMNIIRPDVLWGRAEIDAFCKQCHKTHPTGKVYDDFFTEWESKRRPNGRWVLEDSVCTDCHGQHAIVLGEGQFK